MGPELTKAEFNRDAAESGAPRFTELPMSQRAQEASGHS
jgi:hypothetical protein